MEQVLKMRISQHRTYAISKGRLLDRAGEAAREQINAFLCSNTSGCDAVIDQDAATHDPLHRAQFLPAYDSGDHLHPNYAGLQEIAGAVNLSLFSHTGVHGATATKSH